MTALHFAAQRGVAGVVKALLAAGAVESSSNHPLATAVNEALKERNLVAPAVADYISMPGEGARGVVDGRKVWIGKLGQDAVFLIVDLHVAAQPPAQSRTDGDQYQQPTHTEPQPAFPGSER